VLISFVTLRNRDFPIPDENFRLRHIGDRHSCGHSYANADATTMLVFMAVWWLYISWCCGVVGRSVLRRERRLASRGLTK